MRIKPYYCKKCKKFKGRFQVTNVDGVDFNNCKYCGEKCITTKEYVERMIEDNDPFKKYEDGIIRIKTTTIPAISIRQNVEVEADLVIGHREALNNELSRILKQQIANEIIQYVELKDYRYDFYCNKYLFSFGVDVAPAIRRWDEEIEECLK